MSRYKYRVIGFITLYRLCASPVLIVLALAGQLHLFKWLLPLSFLTDLIDGTLARYWKVTSVSGAKLDSIADDLTIAAAIVGVIVFKKEFIQDNVLMVTVLVSLFLGQLILALLKYGKISSFHTYLAKIAAIFQGTFLILVFLLDQIPYGLFYVASGITILDLIEEIVLVFLLPEWKTNVKGIYWVLKEKKPEKN